MLYVKYPILYDIWRILYLKYLIATFSKNKPSSLGCYVRETILFRTVHFFLSFAKLHYQNVCIDPGTIFCCVVKMQTCCKIYRIFVLWVFSHFPFLSISQFLLVGNLLSILGPLLLIPSWYRVRRHQRWLYGCLHRAKPASFSIAASLMMSHTTPRRDQ